MITVLFSCKACGLTKHALQVPARETPESDVCAWMRKTTYHVRDEHERVSPQCRNNVVDLMIPTEGSEFIGQQVE